MIKIRSEVLRFAGYMEIELLEHDDRGHWGGRSIHSLYDHLRTEVSELSIEIHNFGEPDPARVISAAADVANLAMMIADNMCPKNEKPEDDEPRKEIENLELEDLPGG